MTVTLHKYFKHTEIPPRPMGNRLTTDDIKQAKQSIANTLEGHTRTMSITGNHVYFWLDFHLLLYNVTSYHWAPHILVHVEASNTAVHFVHHHCDQL